MPTAFSRLGVEEMKKASMMVLISLLVFASYLPLAHAALSVSQTESGCATYLTNLVVDLVNSSPTQVTVGDVVTTNVHVIYPDGTPVTLAPQTLSFLWNGTAGQQEYDNVAVTFTGNPGFYNYTQTVDSALAQATLGSASAGALYVRVGFCSASDALGNRGPTSNIGSDETLTPADTSNLNVGPTTQTTQPVSYIVPIAIALLLILAAILLLLRRSRSKKK